MSDRKMTLKHRQEAMERYKNAWSRGLVTYTEVEEGDFRIIHHYRGALGNSGHFEIARCDELGCAEFLTHAHTDMPAALREIRRLEKTLERISDCYSGAESRQLATEALEPTNE